jgi:hypothetical protein
MKKVSDHLKVSLHGMNDRAQKMMANYLEMCCHDIALVVEESESDAEIIDLDTMGSKNIYEKRLAQQPSKPIIALSVQPVSADNVIYVKKPVDIPSIVDAIKSVKKDILSSAKKRSRIEKYTGNAEDANTVSKLVKLSEKNEESETEEKDEPVSSVPKWSQQQNSAEQSQEDSTKSVEHSASVPKWSQKGSTEGQRQEDENQAVDPDLEPKPAESSESQLSSEAEETNNPVDAENASESIETSSIHLREIDRLLKEIHDASQNTDLSGTKEKSGSKKNNRKTIRYAFHPIEAKLKKNSVMSLNSSLTVLVLNISSKGAIIELKKPLKLRGKTTLTIHFDSQNIFTIPARVVRKEGKLVYGLQFLDFQHKLTDYLVNSGRSFFFT